MFEISSSSPHTKLFRADVHTLAEVRELLGKVYAEHRLSTSYSAVLCGYWTTQCKASADFDFDYPVIIDYLGEWNWADSAHNSARQVACYPLTPEQTKALEGLLMRGMLYISLTKISRLGKGNELPSESQEPIVIVLLNGCDHDLEDMTE